MWLPRLLSILPCFNGRFHRRLVASRLQRSIRQTETTHGAHEPMLNIHLFEHPLGGTFSARPGVHIDEAACFDSLARDNDVAAALIVCHTDCEGNDGTNEYVIGLQSKYDWVRPATYTKPDNPPNADTLETCATRE